MKNVLLASVIAVVVFLARRYFAPPKGDLHPISGDALKEILQRIGRRGDAPDVP